MDVGVESDHSFLLKDNHGSHTFFIESEDESESIAEVVKPEKDEEVAISIEEAKLQLQDFNYDQSLQICLKLLEEDYDHCEAHMVVLETFHALGFKNELVLDFKEQLKTVMLHHSKQ